MKLGFKAAADGATAAEGTARNSVLRKMVQMVARNKVVIAGSALAAAGGLTVLGMWQKSGQSNTHGDSFSRNGH